MSIARRRRLCLLLLVGMLVGCAKRAELPSDAEDQSAEASAESPADKPTQAQIDAVQVDVRRMQSAIYSGDFKTVIAMTNPEFLSSNDTDPEESAAQIEAAMSVMQEVGVELELLTFPEAPSFFSGAQHDFVLVPIVSAFKIGPQRMEARTFLLGVKPRGAGTWTFISGEHFEDQNVVDLFSDYPPHHPFPDMYKRRL